MKQLAPQQGTARAKCLQWLLDHQHLDRYLEFTDPGEKAIIEQVRLKHHLGCFQEFLTFKIGEDDDERNQLMANFTLETQHKEPDETYVRGKKDVFIYLTAKFEYVYEDDEDDEDVAEVLVTVRFNGQMWLDVTTENFKGDRFHSREHRWRVLADRKDFAADLRKRDTESKILCGVVKALRLVKQYTRCETVVAEPEGKGPLLCGNLYKKSPGVHECPQCRMKRYIKQ